MCGIIQCTCGRGFCNVVIYLLGEIFKIILRIVVVISKPLLHYSHSAEKLPSSLLRIVTRSTGTWRSFLPDGWTAQPGLSPSRAPLSM